MFKPTAAILVASLVAGCAAPPPSNVKHPAYGLGVGLGYIVASPLLIIAGLMEGIATAPYFIATDLHEMNSVMKSSGASVTLDQTYRHAYNRPLDTVPPSGDTGRVFRHMKPATEHFQNVLRGYGVEQPESFVLTAVRSADREGYTLYGLVQRPVGGIRVQDGAGRISVLTPADTAYYQPYETDANGQPLDVMIDWAGVPRTSIRTQKGQAILMTLAANSVLINRRSDEYWDIERRWISGEFKTIVDRRRAALDARMQ